MTSVYEWVWRDASILNLPLGGIWCWIPEWGRSFGSFLCLVTCFSPWSFFCSLQLHVIAELTTYGVFLLMLNTLFLFSLFPKASFSQLQVCASLTGHWRAVYSHVSSSASLCPISYHPMPTLLYTASCASTFEACHTKPVLFYPISLSWRFAWLC